MLMFKKFLGPLFFLYLATHAVATPIEAFHKKYPHNLDAIAKIYKRLAVRGYSNQEISDTIIQALTIADQSNTVHRTNPPQHSKDQKICFAIGVVAGSSLIAIGCIGFYVLASHQDKNNQKQRAEEEIKLQLREATKELVRQQKIDNDNKEVQRKLQEELDAELRLIDEEFERKKCEINQELEQLHKHQEELDLLIQQEHDRASLIDKQRKQEANDMQEELKKQDELRKQKHKDFLRKMQAETQVMLEREQEELRKRQLQREADCEKQIEELKLKQKIKAEESLEKFKKELKAIQQEAKKNQGEMERALKETNL